MILCQVVRIARIPNEVDTVRVHTECVDEDSTCHPRNIKLHIKVRKILSARIKMRKRLKTPKRHFPFDSSFINSILVGRGVDCLPPTPYLLNNS